MNIFNEPKSAQTIRTFVLDKMPIFLLRNKKVRLNQLTVTVRYSQTTLDQVRLRLKISTIEQAMQLFPLFYTQGHSPQEVIQMLKMPQSSIELILEAKAIHLKKYQGDLLPLKEIAPLFKTVNTTGQMIFRCLDMAYDLVDIQSNQRKAV